MIRGIWKTRQILYVKMNNEAEGEVQMGWLQDFKEFSDGTTAHGVKYIFHPSVHGNFKIVRILFLVVWLVAIAYSLFVIYNAVGNYVGKPTGTKFQVIASNPYKEKPASIQFPTISVCSHNLVTKSYFKSNDGLEELWSELDQWNPDTAENIDFNEGSPAAKYKDWTYEKIIAEGGPANWTFLQCEHFINLCQEVIPQPDFFERETTLTGNCFRINPNGKLRGKGGDYGKMQLMFFADLNEYSDLTRREPQYGYTVVFHDHESYSSTIPSGFWLSPGSIYKVDLSLGKEFREPPPAGSCDPTRVNNTYGRYEENSCIAQCRDDVLMEKCGCVHVSPPHPRNVPDKYYRGCTLEEWATCGLRAYKEWVVEYSNVNKVKTECNCPATCTEIAYKAQLSSSQLSKFYAEEKAAKLPPGYENAQDVLENLLIIDILFTSMQISEIREIVTYGWGNFLGDVGGVLGLFLGASMFTIIEFIQFIVCAVLKGCCGLNDKESRSHSPLYNENL
ncbi:hypothetical protein ACHWQZ_G016379 [Mnemiopsis leidyi]